jgi:hypothetical protein
MDMQQFADEMITQISAKGWDGVQPHIHGVGLPPGWQNFISGMFNDLRDHELTTSLKAVADLSRSELSWPEGDLPEPLNKVTHVIATGYEVGTPGEDGHEAAKFTFPILEIDGVWKIVLAG